MNAVHVLTILGVSSVTRKSTTHRTVLAAITILYVTNVLGGVVAKIDIHHLLGTSGESRSESLLEELSNPSPVLLSIISGLPLLVADGLLVRHLNSNL